jgi:hypothetical protein
MPGTHGLRFRFHVISFALFFAIFVIEILIALFVRDRFIRPYLGDVLAVMLVFFFARSFIETRTRFLALGTLTFAFALELAQYLRLVDHLGLSDNRFASIVIGSTFDVGDLLSYTVGVAIVATATRLIAGPGKVQRRPFTT